MSKFEGLIINAIASKFFEEREFVDQYGGIRREGAPAQIVYREIYTAHKEEISKAIAKNLDIDEIAKAVTKEFIKELTFKSSWNNAGSKELLDQIQAAVVDKIASKKAKEYLKEQKSR